MPAPPAARILIVDDEPALTKSLCDTLGAEGYATVGCYSGQAALEALGASKFDLLLTDLMMPGMDGIALCEAAQKADPNLVSILMTGAGSIASAVKAMKAGALDYVTKPFELSVILAVLSRSLDVRRLRLENAELARHVAKRTADLEAANRALRTSEDQLRALTQRVVEVQEAEREHVALELHDSITQHLCAVLARWQALANKLPARAPAARGELRQLSQILGQTVDTAQRIARNLRPSVLDELGLVPALRATGTEFMKRTGVALTLDCQPLTARLPAASELAIYRILQNALENVAKHARARHVTVRLRQRPCVQLTITDDGIGFDPDRYAAHRKRQAGFGLLSMRERATYVGGDFQIKSGPGTGTEITVRFPPPAPAKAKKGTHS